MSDIKPSYLPLPQSSPAVSATRRRLCQSLLAGAALIGPGMLPLKASSALDLSSDRDLLRALVKMRGSLDSTLVIGWLRAKRFAASQGRIEPLCGFLAAVFSRLRRKGAVRGGPAGGFSALHAGTASGRAGGSGSGAGHV